MEATKTGYRPANGTALQEFTTKNCDHCKHDFGVDDGFSCEIMGKFIMRENGPVDEFVPQWSKTPDAAGRSCTAFEPDVAASEIDELRARLEALHASSSEPSKALAETGDLARAFAKARSGYFFGESPAEWLGWLRKTRAAADCLRGLAFIDDPATCGLRKALEHLIVAADVTLHSYSTADGEASPGEALLADEIERTGGPLWKAED